MGVARVLAWGMISALVTGAAPVPAQSAEAITVFERELAADVVRDSLGSIAAAVFVGEEVVWRGAFGWRDRALRDLATPTTIYRAGSISKAVAALVLLRLVEDGVVSLDEPVATHLPELLDLAGDGAAGAREITFRHLATHTAGLAREPDSAVFARGPFREWKRKTVAAIPATRAVAAPGSGYGYSNIGYALLGLALERAAGEPFERLAQSRVIRPLGMRATSFALSPDDRPRRLATGYVNLPGDTADPRVPRAEHHGRGYRVPGGGLYSTVDDLVRLGMALTGAAPLIPDSLRRLMLTDIRPGRGAGYGLGLQLIDLGAVTLAGHSGTVPGYAAYLLVDPERGRGVVLLRNYNRGATNMGAVAARLLLRLRDDPRASTFEHRSSKGVKHEESRKGEP